MTANTRIPASPGLPDEPLDSPADELPELLSGTVFIDATVEEPLPW